METEQQMTEQKTVEQQTQQMTEQEIVQQQVIQSENTDGFIDVAKCKNSRFETTPHLSLPDFQKLFSNKTITYYDKKGNKYEFENWGILKKTTEQMKDKTGKVITDEKGTPRIKYTVHMKTYISLMGDVVMVSWDNNEVSFYTKLNHQDLSNWGKKMYWKPNN